MGATAILSEFASATKFAQISPEAVAATINYMPDRKRKKDEGGANTRAKDDAPWPRRFDNSSRASPWG